VNDNNNGLWIGTAGGLAHLYSDGKVKTFTTENSELPNNLIESLLADGNGGVWVGAKYGVDDLAHLHANGDWEIFTKEDSGTQNYAYSLLSDGNDGIWIGNNRGLIHFHANKTWTIFNTDNSELPNNKILSLTSDGNNGIWIGTEEGLAHFHTDGTTWSIFNTENSDLPSNSIFSIQPDKNGNIWIKTSNNFPYNGSYDLTHFHTNDNTWSVFNIENSELKDSQIGSIQSDNNGGIWLGTSKGIANLKSDENTLEFFSSNDLIKKSTLPSNDIKTISSNKDGIWIGTDNGWSRLNSDGTFESSHSDDFTTVLSIESDNAGGVWLGTNNGLYHFYADGTQAIFNTEDSDLKVYSLYAIGDKEVWAGTNFGLFELDANNREGKILNGTPDRHVKGIQPDNNGGIWTSMGRAVLHINSDDTRTDFHYKNSKMPNKSISSLHADGHGGVWVGLTGRATITSEEVVDPGNCLVHIHADETLEVIERDNSGPQICRILSIQTDKINGGIWVGFGSGGANVNGIFFGGLGHLSTSGNWEFFYTNNSALPVNDVTSLLSDDSGLWVGTSNGLAHLTFSQKSTICTHVDEANCNNLITNERAAILIHPNAGKQAPAVDFMATHVYQTLNFREYKNDEIYFLSYKPSLDFNRDKRADAYIVDAPVRLFDRAKPRDITVDDIQEAFAWATDKGKLDYPLVVILVGHGLQQNGLQLNVNAKGMEILTVEELEGFLDNYQSTTGNSVVVIIEACYSGFFQQLSDSNRVIISSTDDDGLAYYNDKGRESFLKFYFDELSDGVNFFAAKEEVTKKIQTRRNRQHPQLNDSQNGEMARNLCLNGCWSYLPGILTLWPENLGSIIPLGQPFDFNVQINALDIGIRDVFASIITPEIAHQRNEQGYSWQPTPLISLHPEDSNIRKNISAERWAGHFSQFKTAGKYVITVKAEDSKGFITEAEPIIVTVKDGPGIIYPNFDATINTLNLPAVTVSNDTDIPDIYQAELILIQTDPIILELSTVKQADEANKARSSYANFNHQTNRVYIPSVKIGNNNTYSASLTSIPETSPMQFRLKPEDLKRLP